MFDHIHLLDVYEYFDQDIQLKMFAQSSHFGAINSYLIS
jgi:hypothetical protein